MDKKPIYNILLENGMKRAEFGEAPSLYESDEERSRRLEAGWNTEDSKTIDDILKLDIDFTIKEEDLQEAYKKKNK